MFNMNVSPRGRGSSFNPPNRFERIDYEPDPEASEEERSAPATRFYRDTSRSIISTNDSPDIPYEASLNPYRGCEVGCPFCYARPTHEYLGLSAGLDWETHIMVKEDAPELLRTELSSKRWRPKVIALSGVTDPYQPGEARFRITRRCLEVLAEFRNPVSVITKRKLIVRDADVLGELAKHRAAVAHLSLPTLDLELSRKLEPRASTPRDRLAAMGTLAKAGVPVGVMVAPVIPGLNDHEIPAILEAAADAGATWAGIELLRLPYGVKEIFERWLAEHYPARHDKVIHQIRSTRGGCLNDSRFGSRMRGEGKLADDIHQLFKLARRRLALDGSGHELSAAAFRRPQGAQPRVGAAEPRVGAAQPELFAA